MNFRFSRELVEKTLVEIKIALNEESEYGIHEAIDNIFEKYSAYPRSGAGSQW